MLSSHQHWRILLQRTAYKMPLTVRQKVALRRQKESTARLSQLTQRQRHERHVNHARRRQHERRTEQDIATRGGHSLPAINHGNHTVQAGTAKGMYMSQSVPALGSGYGQARQRGSPPGKYVSAAQRTARRKVSAARLKAQIDAQRAEELTMRYRSPNRGNYRRRANQRNLPTLNASASVPALKLDGIGSQANNEGAALRSLAAKSSVPTLQESKPKQRKAGKRRQPHSGITEGGEWYGIRRQRVTFDETTLARSGKVKLPAAGEVVIAYNAPHEGAVAGMIVTTKGGGRVLAADLDTVALHAAGQYTPPKLKSKLPMVEALPMLGAAQ